MTIQETAPIAALVDAAPMVLWEADPHTMRLRYVSAGAARLLGYSADRWAEDPALWESCVHPTDRERVTSAIARKAQSSAYMLEYRMIAEDGRTLWVRDQVVVEFEGCAPVRRVGVTIDITYERREDEHVRAAHAVFDHAAEGICITDPEFKVIAVNTAYARITGYTISDIGNSRPPPFDTSTIGGRFEREIEPVLRRDGLWEGEIRVIHRDGEEQPSWLSLSMVPDQDGQPAQYIALISDISELIERQDYLHHLAHHDPLTGLPNRLLFRDRLKQAIERARRSDHRVAVAFVDLDGFKPFNDTHGHDVGDKLLIEFARRLEMTTRDMETVGRIGGDEFVILFEDVGDETTARAALERVIGSLAPPLQGGEPGHRVTISVGVSLFPRDADSGPTLMRAADSAMYRAKSCSGISVVFYSEIACDT